VAHSNPITRLHEVALGLGELARELEAITGEPPENVLWWRSEILSVVRELEHPWRGGARARQRRLGAYAAAATPVGEPRRTV
jgi:hypothetical protein